MSQAPPHESSQTAVPTGTTAKAKPRLEYLDIAKGFAAASVVLLHIIQPSTLFTVLAPWHIWQAMPIFLFIAGITGSMSCRKYTGITGNLGWQKNKADLASYYRTVPEKALALYLPYAVVVVIYYMWTRESLGIELFFNTMLMGYLGPGGYFVPLIVQHLIFFPLILSLRGKVGSDGKFLAVALGISIFAELLFAFCNVQDSQYMYRIFYFRYLFVCCLGAVLADGNPFSKTVFRLLAVVSVLYMAAVCYLGDPTATPPKYWNLSFLRADSWYFQHYPAYFYTAFLVLAMRDYERLIPKVNWLITMGKSSYDIFIFQMVFLITIGISLKQAYGWSDFPILVKILIFFICIWGGITLTRAKKMWSELRK